VKTDKIKKILVPLDGSKNSLRGLDMAITLARASNATITGIYVVYAPSHSVIHSSNIPVLVVK